MRFAPLTTGLLTGAAELTDPVIETAITRMLCESSKSELQTTCLELLGTSVSMASKLSEFYDCPVDEILGSVT